MKNKMKPFIFTLILLIQPVKTTQKFTGLSKVVRNLQFFFEGQAKMMKSRKQVFLHQSNTVLSFIIIKHDQ